MEIDDVRVNRNDGGAGFDTIKERRWQPHTLTEKARIAGL